MKIESIVLYFFQNNMTFKSSSTEHTFTFY